ncbi:MAG: hypothetical protein ABIL62_02255 [Planctomycetota bacterium]
MRQKHEFQTTDSGSAWLVKAARVGAGPPGYGGLRPDESQDGWVQFI